MAFSLQYLQRGYASVDLNKLSNPPEGQVLGFGPTMWFYNGSSTGADDTAAEIATSAYFNGATGYLNKGDVIYAWCNDTSDTVVHFYNVTSANQAATVTVAQIV